MAEFLIFCGGFFLGFFIAGALMLGKQSDE